MLREALDYYFITLKLGNYTLLVSDNNSTDFTYEVVQEYMSQYDNIVYYRQTENIGADRNMLFLQNKCETDYFVLLGDGVRFVPDKLMEIIRILRTKQYDIVMCDYNNRSHVSTRTYTDKDCLLSEIGWYVTQMSSYFLSKRVIQETRDNLYAYDGCEFIYYSRMFMWMSRNKFSCYWISDDCITFSQVPKANSWQKRFPEVWLREYVSTILSLPSNYSLETKLHTLRVSSKYYFFGLYSLIGYMRKGILTAEKIKEYRYHINLICPYKWYVYYGFALLPKSILLMLLFLIKVNRKLYRHIFYEHKK